jgi:hypothetical protein
MNGKYHQDRADFSTSTTTLVFDYINHWFQVGASIHNADL